MADTKASAFTPQTAPNAGTDLITYVHDAAGTPSNAVITYANLDTYLSATTKSLTNKTINDFTNDVHADDVHIEVRNESGGTLTAGTPVYITGYNAGNDLPTVDKADASTSATMPSVGLVASDINNNANGEVIQLGLVTSIDTSSFSAGNVLYVSETAGVLTATKPTGAALVQEVGEVVRANAGSGKIDVLNEPIPYVTGFAATILDDGDAGTVRTTIGAAQTGGAEHDGFSDFVANEHVDHSAVSITGGTGLSGGGDITASRSITLDLTATNAWTGLQNMSGGTMRVPLAATPTMAVDGDFAIDTTVTDFSHGILKYYDGEEMGVVAMPIAEFTTPTDGHVVAYNATNDEFELVAQSGGASTFTREQWIPASAFVAPSTSGAYLVDDELATNDVMVESGYFANSTTTYLQYPLRFNKAWDAGTFTVTFLWYSQSGTGNVVWQADAMAVGNDDAMDRTWGSAQTVTDGVTVADDMLISSATSAITAAGTPAKGDVVWLRVARLGADASDTLAGVAYLIGVTVTYTEDASDDA